MAAITDLATASSVGTGDFLVINQSGTDKKVTANKLAILTVANTYTAAQAFTAGVNLGSVIATGIVMAAGNVQALSNFTNITDGLLIVVDADGTQVGMFLVKSGANATQEILDPNNTFSHTADTANSINIYYSSGYKVQNNRGYSSTIRILGVGV